MIREDKEVKDFYVYVHFKKDNLEPFYIGKGTGRRMTSKSHRNQYWQRIVNKHGFVADVLRYFESGEDALEYEKEMIRFFRNEGYKLANLTDGGDGTAGFIVNPETRRKMSISKKGVKKSPEHIEKLRMVATGKKASDATKAKMSESAKNLSPEVNAKKGAWQKGRPRSPETKAKLSAALTGRIVNQPMKVIIVTHIETGLTFEISGGQKMKDLGFNTDCVYACARGERKTHKGHSFRLKDESQNSETSQFNK